MKQALGSLTISDFFTKMAGNPPPGGGSAAALSGLAGVSLLEMAAEVSQKHRAAEALTLFSAARTELAVLHKTLLRRIDEDAEVLAGVLPLLSRISTETGGNTGAFDGDVRQAITVPLAIAGHGVRGLEIGRDLLPAAAGPVVGDLLAGALSCHNAVSGALLMAALNLPLLGDTALRSNFEGQVRLLRNTARNLIEELQAVVYAQQPYRCLAEEG